MITVDLQQDKQLPYYQIQNTVGIIFTSNSTLHLVQHIADRHAGGILKNTQHYWWSPGK